MARTKIQPQKKGNGKGYYSAFGPMKPNGVKINMLEANRLVEEEKWIMFANNSKIMPSTPAALKEGITEDELHQLWDMESELHILSEMAAEIEPPQVAESELESDSDSSSDSDSDSDSSSSGESEPLPEEEEETKQDEVKELKLKPSVIPRMVTHKRTKKQIRKDQVKRRKPGELVKREIAKLQSNGLEGTQCLLKMAPSTRLIREILHDLMPEGRIQHGALLALICAADAYLTDRFLALALCANHGGRKTVMMKDTTFLENLYQVSFTPSTKLTTE